MAARTAWFLNLDADVELAAIASGAAGARTAYAPKRGVVEAMRAFVPIAARSLLDPEEDLLVAEDAPPLSARGLVGRAFCPTPRALRMLARAGATIEPHPDVDVLCRVNARAFASALGTTLPGAAFVTDLESARAMLATSPDAALADTWRVKRNYGMTGRGQRLVTPSALSEPELAFVRAGLGEGGVQIEPNVRIAAEYAIHGLLDARGDVRLGPVVKQRCDAQGAWIGTEPLAPEDAPSALVPEAHRVAGALAAAGYFGPFGVDAYTYRERSEPHAAHLQPRSEINARYTMGFAAPRR